MLHHVRVKHHLAIGYAPLRLFNAEMSFFGSHASAVHYFHFLFVKIIKVSHFYGYFIAAKVTLFHLSAKTLSVFSYFLHQKGYCKERHVAATCHFKNLLNVRCVPHF